jgi:hypothetical protein
MSLEMLTAAWAALRCPWQFFSLVSTIASAPGNDRERPLMARSGPTPKRGYPDSPAPPIFSATHCRTLHASQWKSRYPGSSPSRSITVSSAVGCPHFSQFGGWAGGLGIAATGSSPWYALLLASYIPADGRFSRTSKKSRIPCRHLGWPSRPLHRARRLGAALGAHVADIVQFPGDWNRALGTHRLFAAGTHDDRQSPWRVATHSTPKRIGAIQQAVCGVFSRVRLAQSSRGDERCSNAT